MGNSESRKIRVVNSSSEKIFFIRPTRRLLDSYEISPGEMWRHIEHIASNNSTKHLWCYLATVKDTKIDIYDKNNIDKIIEADGLKFNITYKSNGDTTINIEDI